MCRYNNVIIFSIPASESYQVLLSESFFDPSQPPKISGIEMRHTASPPSSSRIFKRHAEYIPHDWIACGKSHMPEDASCCDKEGHFCISDEQCQIYEGIMSCCRDFQCDIAPVVSAPQISADPPSNKTVAPSNTTVSPSNTTVFDVLTADHLHAFDSSLIPEYWATAYAMSPFISWSFKHSINYKVPSKWPGIDRVPLDLQSLAFNRIQQHSQRPYGPA